MVDRIQGRRCATERPRHGSEASPTGNTVKSDIYSLAVLYEIFTGKRPFESGILRRIEASPCRVPLRTVKLVQELTRLWSASSCVARRTAGAAMPALSVAAALPGGNPLSCSCRWRDSVAEVVVAAGEGLGLAPRVAIPYCWR